MAGFVEQYAVGWDQQRVAGWGHGGREPVIADQHRRWAQRYRGEGIELAGRSWASGVPPAERHADEVGHETGRGASRLLGREDIALAPQLDEDGRVPPEGVGEDLQASVAHVGEIGD